MRKRVAFVTPIITHYRAQFHENVKAILDESRVDYEIIYSRPYGSEAAKRDTVDIPWATMVDAAHFGQDGRLVWQKALSRAMKADLIVIGQENRFLINYVLQMLPSRFRPRLALWGHGRNFQSRNPAGLAERWKRWWAMRADWWFAYTDETKRHLAVLGFPADRITVFNNSVDTSQLRAQAASVSADRLARLRDELKIKGSHVGMFVGGIYPDKRMDFLVEAADHIRQSVPDFELIIVGSGTDLPVVEQLAESRPWIKLTGPRFGLEKVEIMMLGHVFMMPGLMGLAILDAGATGLPVATTRYPWHSPEIAYLQPGRSGIMVDDWQNAAAFVSAVADLLLDPYRRDALAEGALEMAETYSIGRMAENFSLGVLKALSA